MVRIFEVFRIFRKKIVTGCGHKSEERGYVEIETRRGKKTIHIFTDSKFLPVCINCYKNSVIRCARCGEPIFPGNPITVERFESEAPQHAVERMVLIDGKNVKKGDYISCMRHDCLKTISKFKGYSSLTKGVTTLEYINYHIKSNDTNLENFI